MARFDVYRLTFPRLPLVVDVQSNFLSHLATRAIVPLAPLNARSAERIPRLTPVIDIDGAQMILMTPEIASFSSKLLPAPIANLETRYRDDITRALDFLFQGF
ncbi:MAG TPA: plasmid maintenance protein CcdB [Parvularcula sp.]|nr:plasmid maintenance protein CcdB [Parvularcula sp.]